MLPPATAARHHAVQFYGSDETLLRGVGEFLAEGLIRAQPALVIATPAHTIGVLDALSARLINVTEARKLGELVFLDAEETLATFMRGDMPDREMFRRTVGGLIDQTLGGRARTPLRAYGEMVDVLWKKGQADAAVKLEVLWNDLAETHSFQLHCGYSIGNFYKQASSFEQVCEQHTHVITDGNVVPFERVCRH